MELTQTYRVKSIDVLRGLVMIIMAIDHTTDFFHISRMVSNPMAPDGSAPVFFTRWITHFCAPTFVFLSGISAFLSAQKKSKEAASTFMMKRGLWLVLVEITLITFGLTYNPLFSTIIFQVIWVIGIGMIILGLCVRFAPKIILPLGLLLFFGHNLLDYANLPTTGNAGVIWGIFFRARGTFLSIGHGYIFVFLYAILPWTGALLTGYGIGHLFKKEYDAVKRRKFLLTAGIALCLLFIFLRYFNIYGDPTPWVKTGEFKPDLFRFLDTSKYPPSLQFFCMTLGPACIFLSLTEHVSSAFSRVITVYGKVPFFYYICHWYILHTVLVILFFANGRTTAEITPPRSPFLFRPDNFGFSLPVVYLIWFCVVASLYFPCKWYAKYKATHSQWWLRYV